MIDFGDFIKSQRGNVGYPRHKKNKDKIEINTIDNQARIEEAKEKVRKILESGASKRKKKKGC